MGAGLYGIWKRKVWFTGLLGCRNDKIQVHAGTDSEVQDIRGQRRGCVQVCSDAGVQCCMASIVAAFTGAGLLPYKITGLQG